MNIHAFRGKRIYPLACLLVAVAITSLSVAEVTLQQVSGSPVPMDVWEYRFGDVNGDGAEDIVAKVLDETTYTCSFHVLLGNGSGGFSEAPDSPFSGGAGWNYPNPGNGMALVDVNGDDAVDIAAGSSDGFAVLLNDGAGAFSPAEGSPFGTGVSDPSFGSAIGMIAGDVNSDGATDLLAVTGMNGNWASVLIGDGSGGFLLSDGSPIHVNTGDGGRGSLSTGDFNGDDTPDFAFIVGVSYPHQPSVYLMLGNGGGGFVPAPGFPIVTGKAIGNCVVDLNGDARDDLVLGVPGGSNLTLLFSSGNGRFSLVQGPPCNWPSEAQPGDLNGDGVADVVTMAVDDSVLPAIRLLGIYAGDGQGGLTEVSGSPSRWWLETIFAGGPQICDFNRDGKPDVTVRVFNPYDGSNQGICVLQNVTSGVFAPMIEPPYLVGGTVGRSFTHAIRASGSSPIAFSASPLPVGLNLSDNVISGTPSQTGQTRVTVTAANGAGSDTKTMVITIVDGTNRPPVITGGPDASPNPARVGWDVSFMATASDADGDSFSYLWDFGDGSTGSQAAPAHSFAAEGEYMVIVRVTDGKGGSASGFVVVTVTPSNTGDLNGDGVVNVGDLTLVTMHYGQMAANPNWDGTADANGDGLIDDRDLAVVIQAFGQVY